MGCGQGHYDTDVAVPGYCERQNCALRQLYRRLISLFFVPDVALYCPARYEV